MVLLPGAGLAPILEDQLRIFALGALVHDLSAKDHLDEVHQWSDELHERLVELDPKLSSRLIFAQAYLGRAQLLLGHLGEARTSLEMARNDQFWATQGDTTKVEILLDLGEVYLGLSEFPRARRAHEEASPLIRRDERAPPYIENVLIPRHEALADELALE